MGKEIVGFLKSMWGNPESPEDKDEVYRERLNLKEAVKVLQGRKPDNDIVSFLTYGILFSAGVTILTLDRFFNLDGLPLIACILIVLIPGVASVLFINKTQKEKVKKEACEYGNEEDGYLLDLNRIEAMELVYERKGRGNIMGFSMLVLTIMLAIVALAIKTWIAPDLPDILFVLMIVVPGTPGLIIYFREARKLRKHTENHITRFHQRYMRELEKESDIPF